VFDLQGHTALVTGAGRGVGEGIAAALAGQGAAVAVNDLHADRADAVAARLRGSGASAVAAPFDVTDPDAVDAGVRLVAAELGPVDIAVNNAGVPTGMALVPFLDTDPVSWRPYVDLNLYGSLHVIRAVAPGMCERGWGRIVQISSGAGRTGSRMGISLYGAGKSAVEGFARHLSQEVARRGVTVNVLALGLMVPPGADADRHADGPTAAMARRVPVGRLGTPADAGAAVVFLASEESAWLTGQTIALDGGATTH
jgi:NAD(P)-dependent dehydrogenase (short-subunit alcohol dehydrogenase family)